jgi:hypothetical protein
MANQSSRTMTFDQVLENELSAIDRRRELACKEARAAKGRPEQAHPAENRHVEDAHSSRDAVKGEQAGEYSRINSVRKQALRKHLVGLALSGGGIRSATFGVGILQGLAKLGLIKRIDYLSTVSGGGYAGAWLAAWIRREQSVTNVELQLSQSRIANADAHRQYLDRKTVVDEEPEPIYHLRAHSRFLAPDAGLLTADTWSIVATYIRNISINLLLLLPAAMILVLVVRAVVNLSNYPVPNGVYHPLYWGVAIIFLVTGSGYLFWGLSTNAKAIDDLRQRPVSEPPVNKARMFYQVLLPLIAASILLPLGVLMMLWWLLPEMAQRELSAYPNSTHEAVTFLFPDIRPHVLPSLPKWNPIPEVLMGAKLLLCAELLLVSVLGWLRGWKSWALINFALLVPLTMTLLCGAITQTHEGGWSQPAAHSWILYYLLFPITLGGCSWIACRAGVGRRKGTRDTALQRASLCSGIFGGVLLAVTAHLLYLYCSDTPHLLATFTTPSCLLVLVFTTIFHVAQLRHHIKEDEREWWAYFDAYLVTAAIGWLVIFGTVVYLPAVILSLLIYLNKTYLQTGLILSLLVSWAGTTLAGILAGKSRQTGSVGSNVSLERIASVAPPVFLAGLFTLLSLLISAGLHSFERFVYPLWPGFWESSKSYYHVMNVTDTVPITFGIVLLGLTLAVVSHLVDVNLFSLNAMYANRLVRAYLGASRNMPHWVKRWGHGADPREGGGAPTNVGSSRNAWANPERRANPVTGFDLKDDVALAFFQIGHEIRGLVYSGPQLLINTSLNLTATEDLAWSDRKAESFVFSPLHCGARGTGYARVNPLAVEHAENTGSDDILTLGRAIAVSGAAVDPNMSYHQSVALSVFLTIFNARLGYWIENPRPTSATNDEPWSGKSPRYGDLLFSELLAKTDEKGEFIHLSDGGHFENTGVYELLRRRCRYVIACDATTDRTASDDNLANLVRLARIDFGIRIEINTGPLKLQDDDSRICSSHVVIGSIRYDDVDPGQAIGALVYIRTSMTGDEPADILNYAAVNREFPYTTTANQFFDEAQFESYRALGEHVAAVVFEQALADAERNGKLWSEDQVDNEFRYGNNRLFSALRRRWAESMPARDTRFIESSKGYNEIQKLLRSDESLRDFSIQIYPELTDEAERRRVELFTVAQMLQAMENVWVGLDLKSHPDEPISHGWWSIFRRWTGTAAFHRDWPILRAEFSSEFVRFIETRLGLTAELPQLVPWFDKSISETDRKAIVGEFDREWPSPDEQLRPGLQEMINKAFTVSDEVDGKRIDVWAICQESRPNFGNAEPMGKCRGIVLIVGMDPSDSEREGVKHPKQFELLIWIRRPHRRIGLGTYAMEATLKKIKELPLVPSGHKIRLHATYPKPDDDTLSAMWKKFFSLYDFEAVEDGTKPADSQPSLKLQLDLDS